MKKNCIFLLFICLILAKSTFAAEAVLEWNENTDADYYVVYWSTDPDSFDEENSMEVPGDFSFVEMEDPSDGQEYYISVKAFNECGISSDFSQRIVSAYIPSDVTYGDAIGTKSIAASPGNDGGGCFIGSSLPK